MRVHSRLLLLCVATTPAAAYSPLTRVHAPRPRLAIHPVRIPTPPTMAESNSSTLLGAATIGGLLGVQVFGTVESSLYLATLLAFSTVLEGAAGEAARAVGSLAASPFVDEDSLALPPSSPSRQKKSPPPPPARRKAPPPPPSPKQKAKAKAAKVAKVGKGSNAAEVTEETDSSGGASGVTLVAVALFAAALFGVNEGVLDVEGQRIDTVKLDAVVQRLSKGAADTSAAVAKKAGEIDWVSAVTSAVGSGGGAGSGVSMACETNALD